MGNELLRWSRSRWHRRLYRASALGGAFVVGIGLPGGALLAATHPMKHSALWTAALFVLIVITAVAAAVAVAAGVAASVTQPVSDSHWATLKASADRVHNSIRSDQVCDYGGDRPAQAFGAHFPQLAERLGVWDATVRGPEVGTNALHEHVEAAMTNAGIRPPQITVPPTMDTEPSYNPPPIREYLLTVAMYRAEGRLQQAPRLTWRGFGGPGGVQGGGGPIGVFMPQGSQDNWISVPPRDGESQEEWQGRAQPHMDRVDALVTAIYESGLPYANAVLDAQRELRRFRRADTPTILDALELVQMREPPRERRGCKSC